ncbi:MAG: type V CRISPR-associated protein Cas4 [Saprospiraceae bacterium]|nr:type V CRISPR-associated protein Cas4 [Saprospiraceae bacterium]
MESYIPFAFLNDFIFCPRSIYYHNIYSNYNDILYTGSPQIAGKIAHHSIDNKTYSSRKDVIQGLEVYCEKYKLMGKIDLLDTTKNCLTERKNHIEKIYDGYIFQLYAQYFSLIEMNFKIENIFLYDISKNKKYKVLLPEDDLITYLRFEVIVENIQKYLMEDKAFKANPEKCNNCIYQLLCDKALC